MDKSKSLQELAGYDAGDPKTKTTPMVRRCLLLHRTPLSQWSAEDCRLMTGQGFDPEFTVPLALEFLAENPLEGGTMYPSALLNSVLRLPNDFWIENQDLWWSVSEIVTEVEFLKKSIEELEPEIARFKTSQVK